MDPEGPLYFYAVSLGAFSECTDLKACSSELLIIRGPDIMPHTRGTLSCSLASVDSLVGANIRSLFHYVDEVQKASRVASCWDGGRDVQRGKTHWAPSGPQQGLPHAFHVLGHL